MAAGLASDKFKAAIQADLQSKAVKAEGASAQKPVDSAPMTKPKSKAAIQNAIDRETAKVKTLQKKIKELRQAKKDAPRSKSRKRK